MLLLHVRESEQNRSKMKKMAKRFHFWKQFLRSCTIGILKVERCILKNRRRAPRTSLRVRSDMRLKNIFISVDRNYSQTQRMKTFTVVATAVLLLSAIANAAPILRVSAITWECRRIASTISSPVAALLMSNFFSPLVRGSVATPAPPDLRTVVLRRSRITRTALAPRSIRCPQLRRLHLVGRRCRSTFRLGVARLSR